MSGYIIPESDANFSDFIDGEEIEDEESESEEEDIPTLINGKKRKNEDAASNGDGKKKKAELSPLDKALAEQKKKGKELKAPQSDEEIKKAMKKAKELNAKLAKKPVVEMEDSDDDDDAEDEEDSDEEEDMEEEDDDEDDDEDEEEESDEEEEEEKEMTPKKGKEAKSPAKQQQNGKDKTPKKGQETPGKKDAKTPKAQESTANKDAKTPKKDENASPNKAGKTPKKTLKGGVVIEDIKVGSGPEAKRGKTIGMKYEGRLQSNNRVFDGNFNEGKAFKFRLGSGEVIKGWDVGIEGMKVGGLRRIQIPAKFGYGSNGSPPDIPPNANLVFKVECKFVS